uniref:Uncharacterized protein n=1 Tax=Brassica campestris TaxID=3711 RepID=A0A3P5YUP5_BRACM|nr:unnamed protein product [Brassica rapa]
MGMAFADIRIFRSGSPQVQSRCYQAESLSGQKGDSVTLYVRPILRGGKLNVAHRFCNLIPTRGFLTIT